MFAVDDAGKLAVVVVDVCCGFEDEFDDDDDDEDDDDDDEDDEEDARPVAAVELEF